MAWRIGKNSFSVAVRSVLLIFTYAAFVPAAPAAARDYVGSDACASCHDNEYRSWQGSHHDLAMAEALPDAVLGDFDDAVFSHDGYHTTFYRDGDAYMVRTEGPDGDMQDFNVAYTFGIEPLQQYLIETDAGRYQSLTVAWDNRSESKGGQRWFDLLPDADPAPGAPDHWTGRDYNWNSRCASCHSTALVKGYDLNNRTYDTTFAEIDVACESCHGPGSDHVAWANQVEPLTIADKSIIGLSDSESGGWTFAGDASIAHWQGPVRSTGEVERCAPCHARRQELTLTPTIGAPFLDNFLPALLDPGLYHADGQIDDEVFVWGSFQQSKMHRAGVTCSDCHDPHSLETKAPGNDLCGQCHRATVFDTAEHHRHEEGTEGALCVNCHMPAKTYMVIDPRRDHSFRVPRPDLAETLGVPDVCSGCHEDQDPAWAASAIDDWIGTGWRERPSFAPAFAAARQSEPDASKMLIDVASSDQFSPIARGTALAYFGGHPGQDTADVLNEASRDPEPLVRLGAARALASQVLDEGGNTIAGALLEDEIRAVRLESARSLINWPPSGLSADTKILLEAAIEELADALVPTADWPETQVVLGNLHSAMGRAGEAEQSYREALNLAPDFTEATVNLATLFQHSSREADSLKLLQRAVGSTPKNEVLRFALGLALIRQGDSPTALEHLRNAAELAPDVAQYAYTYGIGLNSVGRSKQAFSVLEAALTRHPANQDLLYALATMERDRGNYAVGMDYAHELSTIEPRHPYVDQLISELRALTR